MNGHWIEARTPTEPPRFHIGDQVKVVDLTNLSGRLPQMGEVGTVTGIQLRKSYLYLVKFFRYNESGVDWNQVIEVRMLDKNLIRA